MLLLLVVGPLALGPEAVIEAWGVPLAALIISSATLLMTAIMLHSKASVDEVASLRVQIADLKLELAGCRAESVTIRAENVELMRRLLKLETGT